MKGIRVLMTGAGAPGAPGIIHCYRNNSERDIFVLGVDVKDKVSTQRLLDDFKSIPNAQDSLFLETLLNIAIENKIDIIQPLVTKELEVLSVNTEKFLRKGIKICVNTKNVLNIANDKGKMLKSLAVQGITCPRFLIISKKEDFKEACYKMGFPSVPICFKPTKANGSRGFRVIDESINREDLLFNHKPNSVYISFPEALQIIENCKSFPELLVMEYMPGVEYSIDMLVDKGKAIYTIPRRRDLMSGGISVDCTVCNEKDVIDYSKMVASVLKLEGNVGIQVRRDIDGKVKILEINPRVQGSIVCCAAAGINMPYFGIKYHLGEEISIIPVKWGTRMIRHWEEEYYDANGRPFTY